ncbi:uncharacterized protein LOC129005233 [Macrosteles quadrilineatus]|uniref:uncharacterized protein LOC129005233 n=1 Tax=Macrosteles quadrilineatus TaxID=74068 RepID=UPI0023E25F39|nr:uncharacterized protein LOC129005233 [Macrosteles quadrilineatus]
MWLLNLTVLSFLFSVSAESVCKLPNTSTVLFRNIDLHRKYCWSREELALLYTRRAMMELVPRQIPHNIPLLLEYIHICLTTLKEIVPSKTVYDYMVAALADVFGGYLQTYGLPLLNEAYYEGYVSYDNAAEFYRVQENFKGILMTNGDGWTKPMEVRKHINRILPLKLPAKPSSKPCNLLYAESIGACSKTGDEFPIDNQSKTLIPLPILDDNSKPNSIAIPFKNRALFNLKSRNSYDILIKYYIEASSCLTQSQKGMEQSEFDRVLSNWLKTKILPHLKDETWYVGFSNVLRIEETIQQRSGIIATSHKDEEESLFAELESEAQLTKATYIAIILILLLSILFICFLYWAFIRSCLCCCRRSDYDSQKDSQYGTSTTSLVTNSDSYSHTSSANGSEYNGRVCHHGQAQDNHCGSHRSPGGRNQSQESRLTMSCGLGKGLLPSKYRRHH